MKKLFARFTGGFQYVAGAIMIPIIVLVVCGLLMGFAAPFANYVFSPGSIPHTISLALVSIARMIIGNLSLWFVAGISFGLAKNNKGYAALAGVFMLMSFNTVINVMASVNGFTADTVQVDHLMTEMGYGEDQAIIFTKMFAPVLGIFTYDMSIFSALLCGGLVGWMMNTWGDIKLPNLLSFFAGPKFVILLVPFFALIAGGIMYYVWPLASSGITQLGMYIGRSGLMGTFVYGMVDRALLPFGLHHLVTLPLLYTQLGGSMVVDGITVMGTRNIDNALAGSPDATSYLVRNFTTGRIPLNLGAWPGAALAMILAAKKENRAKAMAVIIPAVFTATFVGVTEPMEFTVLFSNPLVYYLFHVPMAGLSYFLAEATRVSIQGFAVIFMIPNALQPHKMHAMSLLWLIPLYFIVYFVVFRWAIKRFDIKTPGRGDRLGLVSREEYQEKAGLTTGSTTATAGTATATATAVETDLTSGIIAAFGGRDNIVSVENCATRLRVKVKDPDLVAPTATWQSELEALGVVQNAENFQIIYGPRVTNISADVNARLES